MKRYLFITLMCSLIALASIKGFDKHAQKIEACTPEPVEEIIVDKAPSITISPTYVPLSIPNVDSSFKTYMDYRCVTNKRSAQYKVIKTWGWCDEEGFMRANGETELGIMTHYYLVALGSHYGTTMGTKYRITTDTGNVFYAMLADAKADRDTDSTHRYSYNKDVVEFLVDTRKLNKNVRRMGSANVYMPLNGRIVSIERIEF